MRLTRLHRQHKNPPEPASALRLGQFGYRQQDRGILQRLETVTLCCAAMARTVVLRSPPMLTACVGAGAAAKDLQGPGLQEGSEVEPGAGEEAGEQAGAVLHPLEAGLHQRGELGDGVLGEVRQGSLQM